MSGSAYSEALSQVCISGGPAGPDSALPGETAAQQEQRRKRFREFKEEKPVSHQALRLHMTPTPSQLKGGTSLQEAPYTK